MTKIGVTYDCCGAHYEMATAIPETGSALRHASAVDTVINLMDQIHDQQHPECKEEGNGLGKQDPGDVDGRRGPGGGH